MSVPLVDQAAAILLDFDGPICAIFAGYPAPEVAANLRDVIVTRGGVVSTRMAGTDDPLAVLRMAADETPDLIAELDDVLTDAEIRAAASASPTPGAEAFLEQCARRRQPVVIVSNNSGRGVTAYLEAHGLSDWVTKVYGRPVRQPALMKPATTVVREALDFVALPGTSTVLVGDSVSDVQVAKALDIPSVGLANKARKRATLSGATVVIDSMTELLADTV